MPDRTSSGRALLAVLALVFSGLVAVTTATPVNAADPCGIGGNAIACENTKPGTPSEQWDTWGAGDSDIQGFATQMSVDVGQKVDFKISTAASSYTVRIFRTGWYGGDGARHVATVSPPVGLPVKQPQCITDPATELYDCGNWSVSTSWTVPTTAVSGVYLAVLDIPSTGARSHIPFVVRNDASRSDIVVQTSDPTWQAYNTYGGSDFYRGGNNGRAYKVSYNRPVPTHGRDFYFGNEYALVRFLERNGYDVSYISGVDTHRAGNLLLNHKVFMSVGHDEYWSGQQRANVEAARDAGVHLQFLSGNEVYWRTRYEPSADPSRTPLRTLVSYKETWANGKIDPAQEWTGTWRDPRFAPPSQGGGRPENGLVGTAYMVNFSDLALTVSAAEGKLRLWRHTPLATMVSGSAQLAPHTVGYESNEDLDNGHRPQGLIRLSTTTGAVPEYLQDFGNKVAPGTTKHHLTMYRAPSGALVFSAGTIQWSWGLDDYHDTPYDPEPPDPRMQQAQVNLFADMGVFPATLQSGLVAATKSTDTSKPTVAIITPEAGAAQKNGDLITVTGTAADVGGRVAAVEVSSDGGTTWKLATGTTSWSHSFIQHGRGSTPVLVRAVDDSANIGNPVTRSFNVTCPCSVFGQTVPPTPATPDFAGVEVGLRFTPTLDGFVTGARFYKGTGNTGTHVGTLWSATGERLASATFTAETETGWQTVTFPSAVAVSAGVGYTVSYTAPNGRYASEPYAFISRGYDAVSLKVAGGFGTPSAGVYGAVGTFPTQSYQHANYFVDVVFSTTDDSPLVATNHVPAPDATAVPVTTKVSAKFSKPLTAGSAGLTLRDSAGNPVSGTTAYDSTTRVITFTPAESLAPYVRYTARVTGRDTQGRDIAGGDTWQFTTAKPPNPPGVCPCSLFSDETVPTLLQDADTVPVTLGTRFSADVKGVVTGIKFYKGPNNLGVHTGTLWNQNGVALATGTFTNESPSGWQQLDFETPVPIAKNTTYTVSYRAPQGRYSATPNAFAERDLSWDPLRVTSTAGAYTYGTGFPDVSSSTNYLVDVVFEKTPPSIAVVSQDPAPGAMQVPRRSAVRVEFSDVVAPGYSISVEAAGAALAGTHALDAERRVLTWRAADILPADTDITVRLTGVVSEDGAALPNQVWTFRTRPAETPTDQTLFGDVVPDVAAAADGAPIELGTAFTPARDGTVKAIRFFKGPGNAGTHTGSLWTDGGGRLATVQFTTETSHGWQTAVLPEPVPVKAGRTYVVSYHAPQGHYATTPGFFAAPWTHGDLTAPASGNGRYAYGSGGFPAYTYNATNYFVDVVFERAPATMQVERRTPAPDATDVGLDVKPSLTVSAPLGPGWSMSLTAAGASVAGSATLSADGRTVTFTPSSQLAAGKQHQVSVTGLVSTEGATLPTQTWSFTTTQDSGTVSLFPGATPEIPAVGDPDAVELGTVFTPSVDGTIRAVKFYKGPGNTGTHTGSVWSTSGQRLATVTYGTETETGWQRAELATPLPVTAGTTYVVSYYAPNGRYSATPAFFTSPHSNGPLTAPAGENGRYRYGAGGGFPASSYNSTNYFVDVVFAPETSEGGTSTGGTTGVVGTLTSTAGGLLGRLANLG